MTARTSSGESAGSASATEAALGTARAATPAARRTARGFGASSAPSLPSPMITSSGDVSCLPVGTFATSPGLPVKPSEASSGRNVRP